MLICLPKKKKKSVKMIIFNPHSDPLSKMTCFKGRVLEGLSVIDHCYDWVTSLHIKQHQRPLAIACLCFDNMIKIKRSFPDKAL